MNRFCLGAFCVVLGWASSLVAADGKLVPVDKVPAGISEKVASALNPAGQQVVIDGKTTCTVWLVKDLPVKADFKPTLAIKYPLTQGQLIGVMEVVKKSEFTDFRGQDVAVGVYTLRDGQQPVDGNHVGTSALSDFLLAHSRQVRRRSRHSSLGGRTVQAECQDHGIESPRDLFAAPPEGG